MSYIIKSINTSLLSSILMLLIYGDSAYGQFITPYTSSLLSDGIYSTPQEEHPIYQYGIQHGILTIPRIDTMEQVGIIQDAQFEWIKEDYWRLVNFKVAETEPLVRPTIVSIETIVTDSFPVQVFLKVRGGFSGCGYTLGKIPQRLTGNHFEIAIHQDNSLSQINICNQTMDIISFETIIPISVYGLRAGTYTYSLSGGLTPSSILGTGSTPYSFTGMFTLTQDNIFSR